MTITRRRLSGTVPSKSRPQPPGGSRKGVPNRHTVVLKDAILLAAASVGECGAGTGGLQGYLRRIALKEPKSMAMLLARVLPLQISLDLKNHTASLLDQIKELKDGTLTAPTPPARFYERDTYGERGLH